MRIAYCEDEPAQRSRMELLLRTFAERKRLPLTVEAFSDSAAFLFQYPGSYPFDLIFLDIDLGGMDGMALARKIRETDSEVPILFLTNHKEYVFEGYEVQAFRYLLKPVTEDTLFPLLDELQTMRRQEKPHLLLSLGGETQKLFLSDLLFVESDNHYLTLHTTAGTETFKKNLSEFREELSAAWQASGGTGECFAAAHRSYLVNLAHVERITRTECLLSDGTKIPVSRGCYASLMAHIPFLSHYLERKNIEYQNQLLARQVEEVQNIYLTMRGWRHDYHNHLQSMKAYVEMGQYDKLQEYLGLLENDLDQVNQLCDSGNVNLDAILNSKISLAEKNGIRVDYKAACPANLTVSDIDLCALIGNLIDNAVEACEGLADPYIRLYIGVLKNQLYISVTNATKDTVRKLDSEYITTKRGNHGHGLKRINLVVEKYEGYINRQNEPGVFVTEIMLPL